MTRGEYLNFEKALLTSLFCLVVDFSEQDRPVLHTGMVIRAALNKAGMFNGKERNIIYSAFYDLARIGRHKGWQKQFALDKTYYKLHRACHSAIMSVMDRERKKTFKEALKRDDIIFFVCPVHPNCADDHKNYQGKIYVDENWRTKVSGDLYKNILGYIKNRNILTVQEVMNKEPYLTTRPHCQHTLIPIETKKVLSNASNKIIRNCTRSAYGSGENYYEKRRQVYFELNKLYPCKEFKRSSEKLN